MALKDIAKHLAKKGRYGDKHLLHVSDDELRAVIAARGLTINPHTGLPEAWNPIHGDFSIHGGAGTIAKAIVDPPALLTGGASTANLVNNALSGNSLTRHAAGAAGLDVAGLGAGAALGPTGALGSLGGVGPAGEVPASAPFYSGADAEAFGTGINPETGEAMNLGAEPLGDAGGAGVSDAVSDTAAVPLAGPGAASTMAAGGASGSTAAAAGGNALTRYGPLALGGLGLASNYIAGRNAQNAIAHIGDAQRAEGQALLAQYNSGKLTIADQHAIDTYQASATAAAKQYFANSGQSNSTAALSTINTINANVAAMQSQALQNYLKLGTGLLNITDQAQLAAIEQGIANDKSMWQMLFQFGSTYGQWNRSLATMTA